MAKPNQVADLNEKRAARGVLPMTRVEMLAFCYGQWGNGAWPQNWAQRIVDKNGGQAVGRD